MEETIRFELNGKKTEMLLDPTLTLLWVLRNKFGLTGTKYGACRKTKPEIKEVMVIFRKIFID